MERSTPPGVEGAIAPGARVDHLKKAMHYRDQAIHLRLLAGQDENVETREALLQVARTYDRLHIKHLALADPTNGG